MMSTTSQGSVRDVPPILALLGLGLVVGGYLHLESPTTFSKLYATGDRYVGEHSLFISTLFFFSTINAIWIYSLVTRAFGLNRQGSRLEILTGKKKDSPPISWRAIGVSSLVGAGSFGVMALIGFPSSLEVPPSIFEAPIQTMVVLGSRVNFALSSFIAALGLSRLPHWRSISLSFERRLPEMPKVEDGIVPGSIGDDDPNVTPSWVIMNRRALTGNVLVTSSIGGGKTQGTILNYLDQILANFKIPPALLLNDPKGTFIPEARKIIERHGLSKQVLHMRLGGDVTFNPIFSPRPLKEAGFLETAQMIRAAAVNFMGKSFDSPFWEISAFNLIKNSLVLCAAKNTK